MRRSVAAVLVPLTGSAAIALGGCSWPNALDSDPSAWNPAVHPNNTANPQGPASSSGEAGSPGDDTAPPPDCASTPLLELELTQSAPGHVSHRAGEPCLQGCHEAGGTARLAFAAAGSAYRAEGGRDPARPGSQLRGIGGTTVEVDACGNFYAVADVLEASPSTTQPWLKAPTFRRMEKPLLRVGRPGDCNQSGCHDFSGRLNVGIYF